MPKKDEKIYYATESMHIPDKIINTGSVDLLEQYLKNNPMDSQNKPLGDDAKRYLEDRIQNMKYINKLHDGAHHYPGEEDKEEYDRKMLPKKAIKENDLIYLDVPHQPNGQKFSRNCWTMPTVMMLQARGIMDIDQENVLMYRPEISSFMSESVLPEDKRWMNTDTFSNIKYTSGLINKLVPNSGFSQVVYTDSNDEKKNHAYLTNMKGKIQSALLDHGSPVALNIGNHYITVVGMKGDELIYKDSMMKNDPDANRIMNIYGLFDIAKGNLGVNNPTIEMSYTFDITPSEKENELPNELKRLEGALKSDGKGGYEILPETVNDVESKAQFSTVNEAQFSNQGQIGKTEKKNEEGIDIEVQETVYIPTHLNKNVKTIDIDPTVVANLHWMDQLKKHPEIQKTLKNNRDNSLYFEEPVKEVKPELKPEEVKTETQTEEVKTETQTEPQKTQTQTEPQKTQILTQYQPQNTQTPPQTQSIQTIMQLSKTQANTPELGERLNNPPLKTGIKNVEINHFRELEKKTNFTKEYGDMFEKEDAYTDSLPDGPLKEMTKMSVDARNAIKVLAQEPTPENKMIMKEYAKIIVAQKLLAFEHEMNNGKMGATEKNIDKTGSIKIFLSENLVNKLTDRVFSFGDKDFEKQIDDFVLNDRGMEHVKDFIGNSIINSKLTDAQKSNALLRAEEVFDKGHERDILNGLKAKADKIDLSKVNDKESIEKFKQGINKLAEEKNNRSYDNLQVNAFQKGMKMSGLYSEMSETLKNINLEGLDKETRSILEYSNKFSQNMGKKHDEFVKNQNVVKLFENTVKVNETSYPALGPATSNTIKINEIQYPNIDPNTFEPIEVDAAQFSKIFPTMTNVVKKENSEPEKTEESKQTEESKTEEKKQPEEQKPEENKQTEESKTEEKKQPEEPKTEEPNQSDEFNLSPEDELMNLIYLRGRADEIKFEDKSKEDVLRKYTNSLDKLIDAENLLTKNYSAKDQANLEAKISILYDALNEAADDLLKEDIDTLSRTRLEKIKPFANKMSDSHREKASQFDKTAKEQEIREAQKKEELNKQNEIKQQKFNQRADIINKHDSELQQKTGKNISNMKNTISRRADFINKLTFEQKDKKGPSEKQTIMKNIWKSQYLGDQLQQDNFIDYRIGRNTMVSIELQILGAPPSTFREHLVGDRDRHSEEIDDNKPPILPGAEKMSDVELKNAIIDRMLREPQFLEKDPRGQKLIDNIKKDFGPRTTSREDMQSYMEESLKTISVQSTLNPGSPIKNALLMEIKKDFSEQMKTKENYYLAAPLAKDKNLFKAVDSSMKIDHILIRANEAKNQIFNKTLPTEKIPEGELANYMAGRLIENMLTAEQRQLKNALANDKYPNSKTANTLNNICPSKDPYELANRIMKTDTFKKIANLNPTLLRDAIVTDDPSINKLQKTLLTEVKNQAEKEITYVESKGTTVKKVEVNQPGAKAI